MNDFFETFCKSIVTQLKIPRKGVLMFLLILSSILILVNKLWFHYSIAPKGSLLLQLFYGLWIFAFASIPIKAYNEYCDKKDEERRINKLAQGYLNIIKLSSEQEKKIFERFYSSKTIFLDATGEEIKIVMMLKENGLSFLGYQGSIIYGGNIYITPNGLKLITEYFENKQD